VADYEVDLNVGPAPDLVMEVDITHSGYQRKCPLRQFGCVGVLAVEWAGLADLGVGKW
jgi:hypothetical protein